MPYAMRQTDALLRPIRRGVSLLDETSLVNDTSDVETFDSDDPFSLLHELEVASRLSGSLTNDDSSRRIHKAQSWSTGGSTYEETPFISSIRNEKGEKKITSDITSIAESSSHEIYRSYSEDRFSTLLMEARNEENKRVEDDAMKMSGDFVSDRREPNDEMSTSGKVENATVDHLNEPSNGSDGYSCEMPMETLTVLDNSEVPTYANLLFRGGNKFIGGAILLANVSMGCCADRADFVCGNVKDANDDDKKKKKRVKRAKNAAFREGKRGLESTKQKTKSSKNHYPTVDVKFNNEKRREIHDIKKSARTPNHNSRGNIGEHLIMPSLLSDSAKESLRRFEESLYKHPESKKKTKTNVRESRRSQGPGHDRKEDEMRAENVERKPKKADSTGPVSRIGQSKVECHLQQANNVECNKTTSLAQKNEKNTSISRDPPEGSEPIDESKDIFDIGTALVGNDVHTRHTLSPNYSRRNSALANQRWHTFGVNQSHYFRNRKKSLAGSIRRISEDRMFDQVTTKVEEPIGFEAQSNEGTSEAPIDLTSIENVSM